MLRLVISLTACVATLAPPVAEAATPIRCGFSSASAPLPITQRSCDFRFTGTPIEIYGRAHGSHKVAPQVRVWVTVGNNHEAPLVECQISGVGSGATVAECRRELSLLIADFAGPDTPAAAQVRLSCNFEPLGDGPQEFWCQSPEPT
jgi:hypothetical protein